VLYELLTNQRLFLGENDLETLEMVREAHVSAPSLVNKWVSPELDRITLRALHVDPDQRYQRAGELAYDLRMFIQQNAPSTSQATLKSWMYQEFSNYIAHEQAQESHILDQLKYEDGEESVEEHTAENLSKQGMNQLLGPAVTEEQDTQPPGEMPSFKTEAYQAVAVAPYQSDDVPTRPVSAEVFKDLQSQGYQLPEKDYVYAVEADPSAQVSEAPKRTHALESHEVEELLDGSLEEISMSEDGGILEESTPTDELIPTHAPQSPSKGLHFATAHGVPAMLDPMDATAPITQEERDAVFAFAQQHLAHQERAQESAQESAQGRPELAQRSPVELEAPSPFSTMPLFSDPNSPQLPFTPQSPPHAQEGPSPFSTPSAATDDLETVPVTLPREAAHVTPSPDGAQLEALIHNGEEALNKLRDEERERAEEVTGPVIEAVGFAGSQRSSARPGLRSLKLMIAAVALIGVIGVGALALPELLSGPLALSVRVMPRDQLMVTELVEGAEPTQRGPIKSPFKLSVATPTTLRIERDGFEPYELLLDPLSEELSTGELKVELQRLFPKVDLNVSSVPPGAQVWVNDQLISKRTPIKGFMVTPNELGEVKVKVQARGEPQEQIKLVQKGQASPRSLRFMFMLP